MDLKRQLMIFIETEVVPAFVSLGGNDYTRQFLIDLVKYLAMKQNNHSLLFLTQTLVDPGD